MSTLTAVPLDVLAIINAMAGDNCLVPVCKLTWQLLIRSEQYKKKLEHLFNPTVFYILQPQETGKTAQLISGRTLKIMHALSYPSYGPHVPIEIHLLVDRIPTRKLVRDFLTRYPMIVTPALLLSEHGTTIFGYLSTLNRDERMKIVIDHVARYGDASHLRSLGLINAYMRGRKIDVRKIPECREHLFRRVALYKRDQPPVPDRIKYGRYNPIDAFIRFVEKVVD